MIKLGRGATTHLFLRLVIALTIIVAADGLVSDAVATSQISVGSQVLRQRSSQIRDLRSSGRKLSKHSELGVVSGAGECVPNEPDSGVRYGYDEQNSLALGRGFFPENPTRLARDCFDDDGERQLDPGFVEAFLDVSEIATRDELYEETGYDLRVSGRSAYVSGQAKFSRNRQLSTEEDSLVFVVTAVVNYGRFSLRNLRLQPEVQLLINEARALPAGSPERGRIFAEVINRCGSKYVNQTTKSVRYNLIYSVANLSRDEVRDVRFAFNLAYSNGLNSGQVETDWVDTLDRLSRRSQRRVTVAVKGGGANTSALQSCLLGAESLYKLSSIKGCLQQFVSSVKPTDGIPTSYQWGDITGFGVSGCFQQGLARRDEKLAEVFAAKEEANITLKRLRGLQDEIQSDVLPELRSGDLLLGDAIQELINNYNLYTRGLDSLGFKCSADSSNNFNNCLTPEEAYALGNQNLLKPRLPLEIIQLLYNQNLWSFQRWCAGFQAAIPDVDEESAPGRTVAAVIDFLSPGISPLDADCGSVQKNLKDVTSMQLLGQNSYDARPLQTVSGLALLSIVGPGTFFCSDGDVEEGEQCSLPTKFGGTTSPRCSPEASACASSGPPRLGSIALLQKLERLTQLELTGLALNDFSVRSLFEGSRCESGDMAGQLCKVASDCPGSVCESLSSDDLWPRLKELTLSRNQLTTINHDWPIFLETLNLEDNTFDDPGSQFEIVDTFAPMLKLEALNLREPNHLVKTDYRRGLLRLPEISDNCGAGGGVPIDQTPSRDFYTFTTQESREAELLIGALRTAIGIQVEQGRTDPERFKLLYTYRGHAQGWYRPETGFQTEGGPCVRCLRESLPATCNPYFGESTCLCPF